MATFGASGGSFTATEQQVIQELTDRGWILIPRPDPPTGRSFIFDLGAHYGRLGIPHNDSLLFHREDRVARTTKSLVYAGAIDTALIHPYKIEHSRSFGIFSATLHSFPDLLNRADELLGPLQVTGSPHRPGDIETPEAKQARLWRTIMECSNS